MTRWLNVKEHIESIDDDAIRDAMTQLFELVQYVYLMIPEAE